MRTSTEVRIRPWCWGFVVVIALFNQGFSLGLDTFAIATEQALPLHIHTCMHMYCRVQGIKEKEGD